MRKIRGGMILLLKGRSGTKVSSDESGGPSAALRRVPAVLPPGAKDPRRRQVPRVARGRRLGLRPGGTKRAALGHRQCHLPGGNLPGGTRSTSTSTPSTSRRRPSTCRSTLTLQAWHDLAVVSLAVLVFVRVCVCSHASVYGTSRSPGPVIEELAPELMDIDRTMPALPPIPSEPPHVLTDTEPAGSEGVGPPPTSPEEEARPVRRRLRGKQRPPAGR